MPKGGKRARSGRPPGAKNLRTVEETAAIQKVFTDRGGTKALQDWSDENPDAFYAIWAKLLPRNLDVTSAGKALGAVLDADERLLRAAALLKQAKIVTSRIVNPKELPENAGSNGHSVK